MRNLGQKLKRTAAIALLSVLTGLGVSQRAIALDRTTRLLLTEIIPDPYTLAEETESVVLDELPGAYNISQTELSTPSLWWMQDQLDSHRLSTKLVDTWFIFPDGEELPPRVDVVVNQQVWSLLTYLERYQFLNLFGTSARDDGYHLRVFNRQRELLSAYLCDFSAEPIAADALPSCFIFLDSSGQGGLRGLPTGAPLSTPADTAQP